MHGLRIVTYLHTDFLVLYLLYNYTCIGSVVSYTTLHYRFITMYACASWNAFLQCVPSWVLLCSFAMLLSSIFVECVHVQYRNQLNATMSMNDMIVNCVYILYILIYLNSSNCACKSGR